ncbi:unnamed protein product [Callosobruchus maculatus]|nr:unnamed protein product [Callosobruchus maculatus]
MNTKDAADWIDYNYCCYCAEECASSEIRDKHVVQCHMGPQLIVRLSASDVHDAASQNGPDDQRTLPCSKSSNQ